MYSKYAEPLGTAKSLSRAFSNNTGSTINKATPLRLTDVGGVASINVSDESSANAIAGLVRNNIVNGGTEHLVFSGIVEKITTLAGVGDIMYISKVGDLTNTKPSTGVNGFTDGDWIIRVGTIVRNYDNPLLKDILVNIQVVGVL